MGNHLTQCAPSHRRTSPPMGGASHLTGARGDHLTLHVPSHRGTSHLMGGNIISHYISPHKRTSHMGGGSITSHRRKITSHKVSPHKRNISYEGASQLTGENHLTRPVRSHRDIPSQKRITSHCGGGSPHIMCLLSQGHSLTFCLLTQGDISSHMALHFMGEGQSPQRMCPPYMRTSHTGGHLTRGRALHLTGKITS